MSGRNNTDKRKKFILELMGDPVYKPMRLREMASLLGLSKEEKRELWQVLDELEQEGKAQQDKKGRYSKVSGKKKKNKIREKDSKAAKEWNNGKEKNRVKKRLTENHFQEDLADMPRYEGTFIGHNKGFGFVETEELEEDIYIPEENTGTAMHQDRVVVVVTREPEDGKRREGAVVKILERGTIQIVGTYQNNRDYGFVLSDNPRFSKDIFIPKKDSKGVRDGDKVVVQITDYGTKNKSPEGKVIEDLGSMKAPGTDILAIVKSFGIPSEFPDKVLRQAERVPDHVLDADGRAGWI